MYFWECWGSKAQRRWDETGQHKPFGCAHMLRWRCVTHIRYEECKQTQVGNGDRELSRLPPKSGGNRGMEESCPEPMYNLLGFELLLGLKRKTKTTQIICTNMGAIKCCILKVCKYLWISFQNYLLLPWNVLLCGNCYPSLTLTPTYYCTLHRCRKRARGTLLSPA